MGCWLVVVEGIKIPPPFIGSLVIKQLLGGRHLLGPGHSEIGCLPSLCPGAGTPANNVDYRERSAAEAAIGVQAQDGGGLAKRTVNVPGEGWPTAAHGCL